MSQRIDKLTPEQKARLAEWRDKWIAIGLSTDRADRAAFEGAVAECYRAARLEPPRRIVWVSSPIVGALTFPIASYLIALNKRVAVGDAVDDAVDVAVGVAVGDAVDDAIRNEISEAIERLFRRYVGGQFWVGGWYWGSPSFVSFFREVCDLEMSPGIAQAAMAYEQTARSACWWWPHRDFATVCEEPRPA